MILTQITGYEVKPVVPAAAPPKPLPVTAIDVARGGTATLRTQQPHQFSGAKQLVTLAGLSAELDGFYAVEGADQKKDRHKLTIKLPATAGAVVADFLQQVQEQQQQQQMQQDQEEVEQQEQDLFTVRCALPSSMQYTGGSSCYPQQQPASPIDLLRSCLCCVPAGRSMCWTLSTCCTTSC